jgi:hypothetical protein
MSFSRLNYDSCAYTKSLNESTGVGNYMLTQPTNDCDECFFESPYIRLAKSQVSKCSDKPLIDVDSELLGLQRTASKCTKSVMPTCKTTNLKSCRDSKFLSPEDTKLSNPPCTLKGTGWNRWEWLCENPQDFAEIPFTTGISDKTLAKDNHRPILPTVTDTTNQLTDDFSCMMDSYVMKGEEVPFVHWRSCKEIANY